MTVAHTDAVLAAIRVPDAPAQPDAVRIHSLTVAEAARLQTFPDFKSREGSTVDSSLEQAAMHANTLANSAAEMIPFTMLISRFGGAGIPNLPGEALPVEQHALVVTLAERLFMEILTEVSFHHGLDEEIVLDPSRPERLVEAAGRLHRYTANLRFLRAMALCGMPVPS